MSFMRSKDGKSTCIRCGGEGCWACERKGYTIQCPGCGNREGVTQDGNEFRCPQCGVVFGKSGEIELVGQSDWDIDQEEKARKSKR